MAKKKKARKAKRTKATRRKLTRKAKKAGARKVARKKAARKAPRRKAAKVVKKAKKRAAPKPAVRKTVAKPKLPRRVPQAAPPPPPPPPPIAPPPVVDVEPIAPVTPPSPPPASPSASATSWGTYQEEEVGPTPAGVGGGAPGVGDAAPEFELPDQTGRLHSLAQYRGRKVVLYFYPMDDTPGCTLEACGFRDALGSFDARGATVLGVSPDPVASHERFGQKYSLTFPLLADEGHKVAQRYGVWVAKSGAGSSRMGIARTTFVIDADGRVAQVFKNVRPDGHQDEVLRSL